MAALKEASFFPISCVKLDFANNKDCSEFGLT